MDPTFAFRADTWLHSAGKWVFITVPQDESDEIHDLAPHHGGFGSIRVGVSIGESNWKTSVFPQSESGCYVLPIKKPIRTAESIEVGDSVEIELTVLFD